MNQSAMWIWYYGDFEIRKHLELSLRREERGVIYPPFWKLCDCNKNVLFRRNICLDRDEYIEVEIDGVGFAHINGQKYSCDKPILISKDTKIIDIYVANENGLPAIFVNGTTIISDDEWEVTNYNFLWSAVGYWNLYNKEMPPSKFSLSYRPISPTEVLRDDNNISIDFGKQTMARLVLSEIDGSGTIIVYYGESMEECNSKEQCVLFEKIDVCKDKYILKTRAFRYIKIEFTDVNIGNISALYEYLPLDKKGHFCCSDETINKIWDVSEYTLELNSREFFLDGIKRDRWVWAGDAYQSFLLNYYIFFDKEIIERTLLALRGNDPVETHINIIVDYSFYWFIGIYDYYFYTGDKKFVERMYDKMVSLMQFCLNRRNEQGYIVAVLGDWVFIDWADIEKNDAVCAEQILFCKSLDIMSFFCDLLGKPNMYDSIAKQLLSNIHSDFWDDENGGFVDCIGSRHITKHANIMSVLYGYVNEYQKQRIKDNVIFNENIDKIKTPYFKFYELELLCKEGKLSNVCDIMINYWGGMLALGATTFWEEYNPSKSGVEHYEMYGFPYDKSLCHAWGASPIYILGKYFLGVRPLQVGYKSVEIEPALGNLEWIDGKVPLNDGDVSIYMTKDTIRVKISGNSSGKLKFKSKTPPEVNGVEIHNTNNCCYVIDIDKNILYEVKYVAVQ